MHWNGQCTCVGTIKKTPIRKININDVQHIHIINRSNWCFCSIQIHNGIECLISKFVISFSQWCTFFEYMCMIMIPISKQHKNHLFYYLKKRNVLYRNYFCWLLFELWDDFETEIFHLQLIRKKKKKKNKNKGRC